MTQLISIASRLMFLASFVLALLAVWEKLANMMNLTLMRGLLTPPRLLEMAAVALLFVIALQLRELKTALEKKDA
jgi:hypothetical protein